MDKADSPATKIETDWQVGHPITLIGEWEGKRFTDRGEILSLARGKELSFTHWSDRDGTGQVPPTWHVVRYRLEADGKHTKVTLAQFNEGKETEVDSKTREEFRKNWTMMLDGLKQAAEAA